jgi:ABC-type dipeptide/oligopeptide/nickel transport system permease subunit
MSVRPVGGIARLLFILWGMTTIMFVVARVLPADPASASAGPGIGFGGRAERIAALRTEMLLDRPLAEQYARFLLNTARGNLGRSNLTQRPVLEDIVAFLPATIELAALAALFFIPLGVTAGLYAATRRRRDVDALVGTATAAAVGVPAFVIGLIFQLVFYRLLEWLPPGGRIGLNLLPPRPGTGILLLDSALQGNWPALASAARHLALPVLTLTIAGTAIVARSTRAAVRDVLPAGFVLAARARGLGGRRLWTHHVLRAARRSLAVSLIAQASIVAMLVLFTEIIYSWPGIGLYASRAIFTRDFQTVMGVALMASLAYALVRLLTDAAPGIVPAAIGALDAPSVLTDARLSWRRVRAHPTAMMGAVGAGLIVAVALGVLIFTPYDPYAIAIQQRLTPPSWAHLLGTDELGRDLLSRVLAGVPIALRSGFIALAVATGLGIPVGITAGYRGGHLDRLVMRGVDIFLAFPPFVLAMALVIALGSTLPHAIAAIGVALWASYALIARDAVRGITALPYVQAARASGATDARVLTMHVLPYCLAPIGTRLVADLGAVIFMIAGLSFIGLGARPPVPEWGIMVSQARPLLVTAWWLPVFPGLALATSVAAFTLAGDGLREVLREKIQA